MKSFLALLVFLCALTVSAQNPGVRVVHTVNDLPAVDAFFSPITAPLLTGIRPNDASLTLGTLPAGAYTVRLREIGKLTTIPFVEFDAILNSDMNYVVAMMGTAANKKSLFLNWDRSKPQPNNIKLRFVHAEPTVTDNISVSIGGNVYFPNISQYKSTEFIEVPLAQMSTIGVRNTATNADLGKFTGKFDPDNVYTVFLVGSNSGLQPRLLVESSDDEQKPMQALEYFGKKIFVRSVHASFDTPSLDWTGESTTFSTDQFSGFASANTAFYVETTLDVKARRAGQPSSTPLVTKTINATAGKHYVVVAYDTLSVLKSVVLERDEQVVPPASARIRIFNAIPGIASISMKNAANSAVLVPTTNFGTASAFMDIPAGQYSFKIINEGTQNELILAEAGFGGGQVYTIFVVKGQGGAMEARLLSELNKDAHKPMPLLNKTVQTSTRFRVVNAVATESPVMLLMNTAPFGPPMLTGDAPAPTTSLAPAKYNCAFAFPDNLAQPLHSFQADIADQFYTLCVAIGDATEVKDVTLKSSLKIAPKGDSALVRFIHGARNLGNINITSVKNNKRVVTALGYGQASAFVGIPTQQRGYLITGTDNKPIVQANDETPGARIITIIISYRSDGTLILSVLPEDNDQEWRPLQTLLADVTGVRESDELLNIVGECMPNPAREETFFDLTLNTEERVSMEIFDQNGAKISSAFEGMLPAGAQKIGIKTDNLSDGTYFVRMNIGAKTGMRKLVILR